MNSPYYRTLQDFEYKNQNKRGGKPMVIPIPKGSVGVLNNTGELTFPDLRRGGHNPFVYWVDVFECVENINVVGV